MDTLSANVTCPMIWAALCTKQLGLISGVAVLTFREWLDDFASAETRKIGDALIEKELAGIKEWLPKFFPAVMKQYEATCRGERDLFF